MDDNFIKNGKVDFTGLEFTQIADYVKENVFENGRSAGVREILPVLDGEKGTAEYIREKRFESEVDGPFLFFDSNK